MPGENLRTPGEGLWQAMQRHSNTVQYSPSDFYSSLGNIRAPMPKKSNKKAVPIPKEDKPIDEAQKVLDMGAVEISMYGKERQFLLNGYIFNIQGQSCYSYKNLLDALSSYINIRYTEKDIQNPHLRFDYNAGDTVFEMRTDLFNAEPKIKIIEIRVKVLDETGEIIQGEDELKKYGLLAIGKIDRKEQDVINIRELADFLCMEEIARIFVKFDAEKDKAKYDELYKKHYKNIIKFRSE